MMKKFLLILSLLILPAGCGQEKKQVKKESNLREKILPPVKQPDSGPEGSNYLFSTISIIEDGEGAGKVKIFYPDNLSSAAPVVVFIHGYTAISPDFYRLWISHIVRKGNIIIYPYYQTMLSVDIESMFNNLTSSTTRALKILDNEDIPHSLRICFMGHSLGGYFSAVIAGMYRKLSLPEPACIFAVEPGTVLPLKEENFNGIPTSTLLITLSAEDDFVAGSIYADKIFNEATRIPSYRKTRITMLSDSHGDYPLIADHLAPLSGESTTNALDWYGFWKWSEALIECSFYGENCNYINDTPEARFMGLWSDGTPVKQPLIEK